MCSIENISKNKIKELLKLHQKKYRDEQGLFIVEGFKSIEELTESNIEIIEIFSLKTFDKEKINQSVTVIDESTMKKLSSTDSVCEILAVAKKKNVNLKEFSKLKKIALLDSISDPGNLGTIIRSAAAFGIDGIILFGNCVDLYSSKVIRSATGNFFKLPIIQIKDIKEINESFKTHKKIATALSQENNISIKECNKFDKFIIMLGSEAKGLSSDLIDIANKNIRLEMSNCVESLNLSVSASIIFYELFNN